MKCHDTVVLWIQLYTIYYSNFRYLKTMTTTRLVLLDQYSFRFKCFPSMLE